MYFFFFDFIFLSLSLSVSLYLWTRFHTSERLGHICLIHAHIHIWIRKKSWITHCTKKKPKSNNRLKHCKKNNGNTEKLLLIFKQKTNFRDDRMLKWATTHKKRWMYAKNEIQWLYVKSPTKKNLFFFSFFFHKFRMPQNIHWLYRSYIRVHIVY